jgi:hypothetical protein
VPARISTLPLQHSPPRRTVQVINLQNQYSAVFLDTRGTGCEENVLCVSASSSNDRDSGSGWWKIVSVSGSSGAVQPNDQVYLLNQYRINGQNGYLDTRGTGCEGNVLCVSASSSNNRDSGSGTWRVIPVDAPLQRSEAPTLAATTVAPIQITAAPTAPLTASPLGTSTTVVYITQDELRLALQLLSKNLIAYIDLKLKSLDEDEPEKLLKLEQELKVYISEQLNLLLSTSSSGSLAQLKKELFDAVNAKFDNVVQQIGTNATWPNTLEGPVSAAAWPGTSVGVKQKISVRPLPHEHPLYNDHEKLEGDRDTAEYMIKGMDGVLGAGLNPSFALRGCRCSDWRLCSDGQGNDPLGHSAQAMIPYKIRETKHVTADGKPVKCDPLAGWGFNFC